MKNNKNILILVLLLFFLTSVFGNSAKTSNEENLFWHLAPMGFSGDESYKELVPLLILKSLPDDIRRVLTHEEEILLNINSQKKEKKELISKYQNLVKEKNQLFFSNLDEIAKEKKEIEIQKQIDEIELKILETEYKLQETIEYQGKTAKIVVQENFVDDNFLENFSNQEKINCVLTGNVAEQNGFLYIKAKITILAENPFSFETSAVGSYSDIQKIAASISQNLLSDIMNKEKIQVSVNVFPEEIRDSVTISIDGNVYKSFVEDVYLQQGEHQFSVEAPEYETRSFTAILDDSQKAYNYSVYLSKKVSEEFTIVVDDSKVDGENLTSEDLGLYVGGIREPLIVSDDSVYASVIVKNSPVIGEITLPIITETDEKPEYASTYFILSENSLKPIVPKRESSTSLIEKARKRMYTSYGIFLITLPFTFYTNGRISDITNSINSGLYTEDMLKKYNSWKVASGISISVSVTAGINMLIQLGRYIYTANTVLPETR